MPEFKFFCYVCKQYVFFNAETEKDAKQKFDACGHNSDKTKELKKGMVGR